MYQDLWVATDGITTVRFADQASAEIYCAETCWNGSDLVQVRQQVTVSEDGAIIVEPWKPLMDPNVDTETGGTWSEDVFIPPTVSMSDGTISEDDLPVPHNSEWVAKVGVLSYQTGWPFRDLAASVDEIVEAVRQYVAQCIAESKNPTMSEEMQINFRSKYTPELPF